MKKIIIITGFIGLLGVMWCYAESFIVEENQKRPRPNHQVKQEILDLMGRVLEQESEAIKSKAEIQKALYAKIRGYAEGDKKAFFSVASKPDLHRVLRLMREKKARMDKEIESDKKFLEIMQSPLIV